MNNNCKKSIQEHLVPYYQKELAKLESDMQTQNPKDVYTRIGNKDFTISQYKRFVEKKLSKFENIK